MKNKNLTYIMFGVFCITVITVITCGKTDKVEVHTVPVQEEVIEAVEAKIEETKEAVETKVEEVKEVIENRLKEALPDLEVLKEATVEPDVEDVPVEVPVEEIPSEETPADTTKTE